MMYLVILIIAIISVGMAFLSLRGMKKGIHTEETKDSLNRERVVFHSSDVSSSESESSAA